MDTSITGFWKFQFGTLGWLVLGWFILLPLALCRRWEQRPSLLGDFENRILLEWRDPWAWRYCNWEHGIAPTENNAAPYMPRAPQWLRAYVWSAWRNPINGYKGLPGYMRYLRAPVTIERHRLWTIARSGEFWCVYLGKVLRFGWLVNVDAKPGWRTWPVFENVKGVPLP